MCLSDNMHSVMYVYDTDTFHKSGELGQLLTKPKISPKYGMLYSCLLLYFFWFYIFALNKYFRF